MFLKNYAENEAVTSSGLLLLFKNFFNGVKASGLHFSINTFQNSLTWKHIKRTNYMNA